MKAKNLIAIFTLFLSLAITNVKASSLSSETPAATTTLTEEQKQARLEEMKQRVDEIKNMDKSQLSAEEKKSLRNELKGIRKEGRKITGVYISVGALIIIILLLIIIL